MNVGKTLFAQIMEFVPWTSFTRIVNRCGGNAGVRHLICTEQFRVMAFAQLNWRESLRDIEVTLAANADKLYAMGLRHSVPRSTLADANETRDWRIWTAFTALPIRRARKRYSECDLVLELNNTVYALDATTIDLCLSLFEGLAQYLAFYNGERPHQSLAYKTPGQVYASGRDGGAMIVEKFSGTRGESPAPLRCAGDSPRVKPGQRCSAACEEMDAA